MTTQMLTVSKATAQAGRHVRSMMPGVGATVESRLSHDLATDTPTVVTTVTYPAGHPDRLMLACTLRNSFPGAVIDWTATHMTIVRSR